MSETPKVFYDYNRQAWVRDGVYVPCGHQTEYTCDCYGRLHAGERAPDSASEYLRLEYGRLHAASRSTS